MLEHTLFGRVKTEISAVENQGLLRVKFEGPYLAGLEPISTVLFQISLFRVRSEISVTSCLASRKPSRPMAGPLPCSMNEV